MPADGVYVVDVEDSRTEVSLAIASVGKNVTFDGERSTF